GGADAFVNLTALRTTAFGGPGSDLLVGGTGSNQLFGEGGDDVLVGNLGDRLVGGNGLNTTESPLDFALSGGLDRFTSQFAGNAGVAVSPQVRSALGTLALQNAALRTGLHTAPATFNGANPAPA